MFSEDHGAVRVLADFFVSHFILFSVSLLILFSFADFEFSKLIVLSVAPFLFVYSRRTTTQFGSSQTCWHADLGAIGASLRLSLNIRISLLIWSSELLDINWQLCSFSGYLFVTHQNKRGGGYC